MNTKTQIKDVENQLKKLFISFGSEKWVKVAFILSKLDLSFLVQENSYSKYPLEAMLKLYLLKRIRGLNHYDKIIKDLSEDDAINLGFFKDENNKLKLPPKRTFNHYIKNKLENKEILNHISELIISLATKNKIVLDIEVVKKTIDKNKKKIDEKNKSFKEAVKLVKKLVYPQIEIKLRHNAKFTTRDLLDVLVYIAQTHDFCTNGVKTFNEINSDRDIPARETILYHFKKLNKKEDIEETFRKIFDVIFEFSKKNYKLLNRRKVNIAIDIHKIPYYGNRSDDYVMEGKHERGTTHFFQFITCSIVVAGRRFMIDAVLMHKFDDVKDLVEGLIKRTKEKVKIDKVYLDRGFNKAKVVNVLKKNKVKFVMPQTRTYSVKAWMDKSKGCKARVIEDFEVGREEKAVMNLILVDDIKGIKRAFITNFHIPEQLTHYLFRWYSKRWGIETGYRQLDQDFKPRTTSKNYCLRLFYFLFSVCLYNLWILINVCVSVVLYGRVVEKPLITSKLFALVLYRVNYEDPP